MRGQLGYRVAVFIAQREDIVKVANRDTDPKFASAHGSARRRVCLWPTAAFLLAIVFEPTAIP